MGCILGDKIEDNFPVCCDIIHSMIAYELDRQLRGPVGIDTEYFKPARRNIALAKSFSLINKR